MIKALKYLLCILYAAEVLVLCHEPVNHFFHGFIGHQKKNQTKQHAIVDVRDVLKRAYVSLTHREERLMAAIYLPSWLTVVQEPKHEHPLEKHPATERRRRREWALLGFLLLHLAPLFKKQHCPGARAWTRLYAWPPRCRHHCHSAGQGSALALLLEPG